MSKKLKREEISFKSTDISLALKWNDKKEIWMLSALRSTKKKKQLKTEEAIYKSKCIKNCSHVCNK